MTISERVQTLRRLMTETALCYHRSPDSIMLLAVGKGQPINAIQEAFKAGVRDFGESYLQEAKLKIEALRALPIHWHFIGPVQSNKISSIALNFAWVHSISREKIAKLLSQHRPSHLPPLNICLQVNLDNEASKSGINPGQLSELACLVNELPQLKLRGLMAIPRPQQNEERQYESFLRLNQLMHEINHSMNLAMDTLSMGMSDDFVAAIRAGSTLVRIGRAIFGNL